MKALFDGSLRKLFSYYAMWTGDSIFNFYIGQVVVKLIKEIFARDFKKFLKKFKENSILNAEFILRIIKNKKKYFMVSNKNFHLLL